jgi:hypothetical protein
VTVPALTAILEVQLFLVAALLLGGCLTKLARTLRTGAVDASLGPTALFPMSMRRPAALTMCLIEGGLGAGLIITAGGAGGMLTRTCVRLGAGLLFLVATSALIELRTVRPDVGCGCFGEFSTAPVSGRTIARAALLAVAALSTIDLHAIKRPPPRGALLELLTCLCIELLVIGALSPEVGEGLIRLGYSEPCELRAVSSARTLAALRHSKQWRRYASLIASDAPADVWRELCWRYVVYPSSYQERPADLVFAVFLQHRRPTIHAALVDAGTGLPLPWPAVPTRRGRPGRVVPLVPLVPTAQRTAPPAPPASVPPALPLPAPAPAPPGPAPQQRVGLPLPAGLAVAPARDHADMPLSTDL